MPWERTLGFEINFPFLFYTEEIGELMSEREKSCNDEIDLLILSNLP